VAFDTPEGAGQDFEYTLEARVTDASRREIQSSQVVRVSQKAYAVEIRPDHQLHRPGDELRVSFEARDANDGPVSAEGRVKLGRRVWTEVWIDPQGREQRGAALELARTSDPLVPLENRPGWRLVRSGYEDEEVATALVRTDEKGAASWSVTVVKEGYYSLSWTSRDDRRQPIAAQAALWVAREDTRVTGYRSGGIELVIDKDTFKLGEQAAVMICADTSSRWVLLTVEGERLHSFQVVHLDGTAKLVEIPIGEQHLPNAWLSVFSAARGQAFTDTKEIIVPPTPRFLSVELQADAAEHEPGTPGSLTVITKDSRGEPVSAEVTLSLVDESVLALQSEYAGDPRPYFFGQRREHRIQTSSSIDSKPFRRLVRDEHGALRDDRLVWAEDSREGERDDKDGSEKAGFGGKKHESLRALEAAAWPRTWRLRRPPRRSAWSPTRAACAAWTAGPAHGRRRGRRPGAGRAGAQRLPRDRAVEARPRDRRQGRGQVSFTYPESLTRWKAARACWRRTRAPASPRPPRARASR
jgi:hypothetical protein